jgi:cell division protein FtsZ
MPKFASDPEAVPPALAERRENHDAEPELRAVPASVFDDDFFQRPPERVSPSYVVAEESVRIEVGLREPAYFSPPENVQHDVSAIDTGVRAPFSGSTTSAAADAVEPDELDIPAFLRRGH